MKRLRLEDCLAAIRKAYEELPRENPCLETDTIKGLKVYWYQRDTGQHHISVVIECDRTFRIGYQTGYRDAPKEAED